MYIKAPEVKWPVASNSIDTIFCEWQRQSESPSLVRLSLLSKPTCKARRLTLSLHLIAKTVILGQQVSANDDNFCRRHRSHQARNCQTNARLLGLHGWYSTNILGNRDGEVLDDPGSFKTKEESKLSVLEYILQPSVYPELYSDFTHLVRINYYPPRGDNKEGWDNIDIFGWLGYQMQIKIDFLCRDSILAAPIVLDLALFMDLAQRAGMRGIQEWLSFYFKSPMCAPKLYPEHDLFIQLMKLKNTLRHLKGEELITHLGLEYYD